MTPVRPDISSSDQFVSSLYSGLSITDSTSEPYVNIDRVFPESNDQSPETGASDGQSEHTSSAKFYEDLCTSYLSFTNSNPTTYHAVSYFSGVLKSNGFTYLNEKSKWDIPAEGGAFYTTRADQSLVAFIVGGNWKPECGIGAIGCHVDALTAKLKPSSIKSDVHGYNLLAVAPYSGALNHLWLDRDLGIAGSVLFKEKASGKVSSRLVTSGRHAICRVPSLAPHFGAMSSVPYNKETKMVPVMGYGGDASPATPDEEKAPLFGKHSLVLLRYIAKLAECEVSQIVNVDLELFDVQEATRGGLSNDFMYAPRIDDRLCSFSAIKGLIQQKAADFKESEGFSAVLLANNEEIGSATRTGAKGRLLNSVVERVVASRDYSLADAPLAFANSVILSADVTHALNPNFTEAYLENHFPLPNKGLTIKMDANGHVVTDAVGVALMNEIAAKHKLTLQQFHIKNDMPSGGTIGPMLTVDTGARVIDVGLAQLSMHSIRASAGWKEPGIGVETFSAFFSSWREVADAIDCN